ncbi:ComEA family DNA-binding protein [uncultured Demequina sp.]|uniref:ComEA family DNA-binding protein n=1 Tax=uncultured Demequina sp. TaxID=693499 RepID=UPI0025D511D0|nr:ComEA family DNA-binding protein [uncultured Demequina sp.]
MSTPVEPSNAGADRAAEQPGRELPDRVIDHWRESAARAAGHAYEAAYGREIHDASTSMRWRIEPRVAVTVVAALVVLAALAWWLSQVPSPVTATVSESSAPLATAASPEVEASHAPLVPAPAPIVVHVSGAVASPGLVELGTGARVADAVDAAGGLLDGADLGGVNLARVAADGEQIHVPEEGELSAAAGPINLNAADPQQLQQLPGVGEVMAERIVADRDAHGPFASVDDVQRVSGVGPAMVAGWDGLAQV